MQIVIVSIWSSTWTTTEISLLCWQMNINNSTCIYKKSKRASLSLKDQIEIPNVLLCRLFVCSAAESSSCLLPWLPLSRPAPGFHKTLTYKMLQSAVRQFNIFSFEKIPSYYTIWDTAFQRQCYFQSNSTSWTTFLIIFTSSFSTKIAFSAILERSFIDVSSFL